MRNKVRRPVPGRWDSRESASSKPCSDAVQEGMLERPGEGGASQGGSGHSHRKPTAFVSLAASLL